MIKTSAFVLRTTFCVALLAGTGVPCGATIVDARLNSWSTGLGADGGVSLFVDQGFSVEANGLWRNDPDPRFDAGPDGNTFQDPLMYAGLTANFGTLVAQVGQGPVFAVGSSFSGRAVNAGELKFFFWDVDSENNSGTVNAKVSVSVVPEPSSFALLGLGLAMIQLRRRKAQ